ncbi:MAG: hypothetical protein D6728_06485 [Cyanobacteria bacterium J055]|nr:MAG: hypothetical protein D6728_06485 [Cyanobacteria bacterium J055]
MATGLNRDTRLAEVSCHPLSKLVRVDDRGISQSAISQSKIERFCSWSGDRTHPPIIDRPLSRPIAIL